MFHVFLRTLLLILFLSLTASALWIPFLWTSERSQKKPRSSLPSSLRQLRDSIIRSEAYQSLPWVELAANYSFFPRDYYSRPLPFEDALDYDAMEEVAADAEDEVVEAPPPTKTAGFWRSWKGNRNNEEPTKTRPDVQGRAYKRVLLPRSTFTFSCPTSVQCNDGGCCPLGDYCAIRNGQLGCCPIGSLCDAGAIPGCSVSCFGVCCDLVQGIIGEPVCSSTPGAGGQASGICTGVEPSSPLFTAPASCPTGQLICGQECCPSGSGLVCDNITIPGQPFCNLPADVCPPGMRKRDANDTCLNVTTDTAAFSTRVSAHSALVNDTITSSLYNGTFTSTPDSTALQSSTETAGATVTTPSETVPRSSSATGMVSAASSTGTSSAAATGVKSTAAAAIPRVTLHGLLFVVILWAVAALAS